MCRGVPDDLRVLIVEDGAIRVDRHAELRVTAHDLGRPVAVVAKLRDRPRPEDRLDVRQPARLLGQQPVHPGIPVVAQHVVRHVAMRVAPVRQDEVVVGVIAHLVVGQRRDDILATAGVDEARFLADQPEGRGHAMPRVDARQFEQRVI
jgi:hypothetical protein